MKKNPNRFSRLLRYYATIVLVLIFLLPLIAVHLLYQHNTSNALAELNLMHYHIQTELAEADQDTQKIAQKLTETTMQIEALKHYASSSYQEALETFLMNRPANAYLPDRLNRLHKEFRDVSSIVIHMDNASELIVSTVDNPRGRKIKTGELAKNEGHEIGFDRPLFEIASGHSLGQVQVNYQDQRFFQSIAQSPLLKQAHTVVLDSQLHRVLLERGEVTKAQLEAVFQGAGNLPDYLVVQMETGDGQTLVSLLSTQLIWGRVLGPVVIITIITCVIAAILLVLLYRFFGAYSNQVHDMVTTLKRIGDGQFYYRIREADKQDELGEITQSINSMLDRYQMNIRALYLMEIREHEATLKALQSQINPHFMYNTLEFIRMSALTEGADELADIVYDFAALLRNNISDEKETSLAQELDFCLKYLRLYQARYPAKLEVEVDVEPACRDLLLPKFTLQPLIENYMVHGVDFARFDNRLLLKARLQDNCLCLLIQDNGRGMIQDKIVALNRDLQTNQFPTRGIQEGERTQSIGIRNVRERLGHYFGQGLQMNYQVNESGGVSVWLSCPLSKSL